MKKIFFLFAAFFVFAGCTHVISEESRLLVDPLIRFKDLSAYPDAYVGRYVMLGGTIAGLRNEKSGSQLEIVQSPLESNDMPEEISPSSGGRFLAATSRFLDPMVYKTGRKVTVIGEVLGKKSLPIDQMEYSYPVITIREIHVWSKPEFAPSPYPPPGYYYDPYWWGSPYWWYPRPYY